jgi:hypothetical protein
LAGHAPFQNMLIAKPGGFLAAMRDA